MNSDGEMQRLTVDGAELGYTDRGRGEPILLVHAGVFSEWFAPLGAGRTLDGFRVIRVRRAGYGKELPSRHLTIEDDAAHCAALIAHLGLDSVHYVGHSSSSLIGLQLALDHPELVRSLTLLEPAPAGSLRSPGALDHLQRIVVPAMGAFASGDLPGAFDLFMTGVCGADHATTLEERLGREGYRQAIRQSAFFFADEMRAIQEWNFGAAEAGRVRQPTLVVEGGQSHLLTPIHEIVEILTGLLPDAQTAVIDGVNHMMPLQDPDAVGRVIAAHARRHPIESRGGAEENERHDSEQPPVQHRPGLRPLPRWARAERHGRSHLSGRLRR